MRKTGDGEQLLEFARPPVDTLGVVLHFDGGTGPTNPGNAYGSWQAMCELDDRLNRSRERVQFGMGTNNEAEWKAFLDALEWLSNREDAGRIDLTAWTDSQMLVWQCRKKSRKVEAPNLRVLHERAMVMLGKLASWSVQWNPRDVNVALFGH